MPARKVDPVKFCEHCGKQLVRRRSAGGSLETIRAFTNKRRFCDWDCRNVGMLQRPPQSLGAGWYRARRFNAPGPCSVCGALNALDAHHLDGDPRNNALENLARICRSCHVKQHRARTKCTVCGAAAVGRGYCVKHYQRVMKYGSPLVFKIRGKDGKYELISARSFS